MSNKMPKAGAKKTKSALSPSLIGVFLLLFVSILTLFIVINDASNNSVSKPPTTCVNIGSACIELERTDTSEKRVKGLSGRDFMVSDQGMLFVFDETRKQCMWMKDMKFSIDIIWINEQKEIVKVEKNVAPATYPNKFCADSTMYVVELVAGTADQAGIKVGDDIQL